MTDEHLDQMIRDADPYRPEIIPRLDGAARELMEEIMSVPSPEFAAGPPERPRNPYRAWKRGLAGAGVAATLLAGALTISAVRDRPAPAVSATAEPMSAAGYSAVVLKAAEQNPRLLIDQPGWRATTVYGFAEEVGTISFSNGDRQLEMNWYPADQYDSYHQDRLGVSSPEAVTVDGSPADLFRYSASDFAVMLRPRDASFVELRTGGTWTREDFNRVLTHVIHVDVRTWLAALPAQIVTPQKVDEQAAKILADVPLPPGFDTAALRELGTNDPYQFGAKVTGRVGCGWIAAWLRADKAGDATARQRAADALRSSHHWTVLQQMTSQGDWSRVFWEIADQVAAGQVPDGYKGALGCGE